jgi:hypothetical protein
VDSKCIEITPDYNGRERAGAPADRRTKQGKSMDISQGAGRQADDTGGRAIDDD